MGGAITTDAALIVVIAVLVVVAGAAPSPTDVSVCLRDACNCTAAAPRWLTVSCAFDTKQVVELGAGAFPPEMLELNVTGGGRTELRLGAGAFTKVSALQRVRVSHMARLVLRRHAFYGLSTPHTVLEVMDCDSALVESHAFRSLRGPLTALITRCLDVVVQGAAFSWILAITVKDVPRLELLQQAFAFETSVASASSSGKVGRHGPAATVRYHLSTNRVIQTPRRAPYTTRYLPSDYDDYDDQHHLVLVQVLLQNVMLPELPQGAFPSSAAEVRFVNTEVRTVRRDAFCANTLFSVVMINSSLHRVETGAFSDRTLIHCLELDGVKIHVLAPGAFLAAVTNLTIQHSRVSEVQEGALNITVATAMLSQNVFQKVHPNGLVLKQWNRVVIEGNTFERLETGALRTPFDPSPTVVRYEFTFFGNELTSFGLGALRFAIEAAQGGGVAAHIGENRFAQICHCDLVTWIRDVVARDMGATAATVSDLFNTSLCAVDSVLARCFGVPQGFVNMRNFTELVCGSGDVIVCEEQSAIGVVRSGSGDIDLLGGESELQREKKVLGLVFLVAVCAMIVILVVTGVLWLRRNGYCLQAQLMLLPTATSCFTMCSRFCERDSGGLVAATSARSISRLSMHEYNEMQQQQKRGLLLTDNASAEVVFVPCEDKWTQTLPEELTQELLQSLREKLDDPENYGEARDMIEHLYDLIKVEESCNNNNTNTTLVDDMDDDEDDDGENVYDVIQPAPGTMRAPRIRLNRGSATEVCSVGTRAPSPDKLQPYGQTRWKGRQQAPPQTAAVLCEYVEPRDREQHLYAELPPGTAAVPTPSTSAASPKSPSRPLSFLRALGESLLPGKSPPSSPTTSPPGATASLLCEYAEPTDAAVHVYSELPPASIKMANRPLPSKPGDEDPGEGTSK